MPDQFFELLFFRVFGVIGGRNEGQSAIAPGGNVVARGFFRETAQFRSERGGLLRAQDRLAPIVNQGQLPQVVPGKD